MSEIRNVEVSRAHKAEYTWEVKNEDRGVCVCVEEWVFM